MNCRALSRNADWEAAGQSLQSAAHEQPEELDGEPDDERDEDDTGLALQQCLGIWIAQDGVLQS